MRAESTRFDVIAHCLPTRYGENLSLKLINRDTFLKTFDQLGIPDEDQPILEAALGAQAGLVIISAPLFHGSTTTLYAVMAELARDTRRKVMSIEAQNICPVPNVSQIALGDAGGDGATLTTLKALGTIQPDVLVLGDLLDSANMVAQIQRFMGQMLVVATLESNRTVQAVQKLLDLGMGASELSQSLQGVLNQRLVRQICPACSAEAGLSQRALTLMGLSEEEAASLGTICQGRGCEACSNLGYRGRLALFETLGPSPGFRKALARKASEKVLEREAIKGDVATLRGRALTAIRQGLTTLEEFQKGNF
jgi:type II secretory ATPase GspE/PulE/Tfp pilus assembly ATPase PilB-like protein